MRLIEFSMFRKSETGLPVNLWVDETDFRPVKHNFSRLKFQNNFSDRFTSNKDMIPISVEDEPKVLLKSFKPSIKKI